MHTIAYLHVRAVVQQAHAEVHGTHDVGRLAWQAAGAVPAPRAPHCALPPPRASRLRGLPLAARAGRACAGEPLRGGHRLLPRRRAPCAACLLHARRLRSHFYAAHAGCAGGGLNTWLRLLQHRRGVRSGAGWLGAWTLLSLWQILLLQKRDTGSSASRCAMTVSATGCRCG